MARHRLTDEQWKLIQGSFPKPAATGRPPADPRLMMDGILWRLRTGSPWRDLPQEFGPWVTVYKHFDQWNSDGTLDKIKQSLLKRIVDADGVDTDLWCVDGTVVRAARCAGGGGKKGIPKNRKITV
jgi:transposase